MQTPPAQDIAPPPALEALSVRRGTLSLFLVLIAALWLTQHQYIGIDHDARLYLLLALDYLRPDLYSHDVFVAYGSQGAYTIFTPLLAAAIRLAGSPARGLFVVWLLSYPLFVAGVVTLCRRLLPSPWWALSVGLVLLWPGDFGIQGFLAYGELFTTPRPAAEGLTLIALALFLGRRTMAALIALVAALALHPLMAAPGAAVVLLARLSTRRQWLLAAIGGIAVAAIAAASPYIDTGPFHVMDPAWLQVVRLRTPYLFPGTWDAADWGRALCPLSLLTIALAQLPPADNLYRLLNATVAVALLGLAATLLCVDLVPNVLVTQAQPWRSIWLAKLLAIAVAPVVGARLWRNGVAGQTVGLLLLAGWLASPVGGVYAAVGAAASWLLRRQVSQASWKVLRIGSVFTVAVAVTWALVRSFMVPGALLPFTTGATLADLIRSTLEDGVIVAAALLAAWWLLFRLRKASLVAAATAAVGLAGVPSALAWSSAPAFVSAPRDVGLLREQIPTGSQVYWPGHVVETWLLLERPSYLSSVQGTGSLFSRQAALEIARRAGYVNALSANADILRWRDRAQMSVAYSAGRVLRACADPALGFIVLPKDVLAHSAGGSGHGTTNITSTGNFLMIDCRQVRETEQGSQ